MMMLDGLRQGGVEQPTGCWQGRVLGEAGGAGSLGAVCG